VTLEEGASWTFDITGLVDRPCTLSLADLIDPSKFQTVTLPVTLVCAGNRRKEQNTVAKSLGFSWGPAGLSTALFTGVYLSDVIDYVRPRAEGVFGQEGYRRPEHVIFEGAEDLPNGKYGTSQRLRWARQKEKGMLLAWAMNGEVRSRLLLSRVVVVSSTSTYRLSNRITVSLFVSLFPVKSAVSSLLSAFSRYPPDEDV
jgi:nitrate reductase (NAD(P)H)